MKSYVSAILIPFDFSLTPEQTEEVFALADIALEAASDEELFSDAIRIKLDQLIEPHIKRWHKELLDQMDEIRYAAVDYVTEFLATGATDAEVERLMTNFATDNIDALETELRKKVRIWMDNLHNDTVRQYDTVSIKDLVFAEIRSWC